MDATVARLRRYVYLKTQLLQLFATAFNGLPEWEAKGAISLHLWQDAEHCMWFRDRITEMRTPPHHLEKVPDPALAVLVDELRTGGSSLELLAGIYEVLKPAMVAAYREHLAEAHPIADHPTRRLLQFALAEEEAQIAWGRAAVAALQLREDADKLSLEAWGAAPAGLPVCRRRGERGGRACAGGRGGPALASSSAPQEHADAAAR